MEDPESGLSNGVKVMVTIRHQEAIGMDGNSNSFNDQNRIEASYACAMVDKE